MGSWFANVSTAVLDTLNQAVSKISSVGNTAEVIKKCPLQEPTPWTLKIKVTSEVAGKWPAEGFHIGLDQDGVPDPSAKITMTKQSSEEAVFSGTKETEGDPNLWLMTWDIVSRTEDHLSLKEGDTKSVEIKIRPKPWVAFHVVDHETGNAHPGVTLTVDTPGQSTKTRTSADEKVEVSLLTQGSTCKMETLEHPDGEHLWYVEEFTSA